MTVMEEKVTSVPSRTKDIAFSGGLREWGSRNLIIQSGSQEQMLAFFLRAPGVMLMLGYGAGITTNAINVVSIHERRQMIVKLRHAFLVRKGDATHRCRSHQDTKLGKQRNENHSRPTLPRPSQDGLRIPVDIQSHIYPMFLQR